MSQYLSGIKLKEGDKINDYEIISLLRPGAFSFSCKAVTQSGKNVFLKKFKHPGGSSPWIDGFNEYQSKIWKILNTDRQTNKVCVNLIDSFLKLKEGGDSNCKAYYQTFEWIDGITLSDYLAKSQGDGTTNWTERVEVAIKILAAVSRIHSLGIVHCDLKPSNIFVLPESGGELKILITGLEFSLIEDIEAPWHGHTGYVGTPGYMSPEHLKNLIPERASDVYTLALIIGELLGSGHPAAGQMDQYDELVKSANLTPVEMQQHIEHVPDMAFLNNLVNACLCPEPSNRPTADTLSKAFKNL
jgi:serine/threonine protein kinase